MKDVVRIAGTFSELSRNDEKWGGAPVVYAKPMPGRAPVKDCLSI